MTTMMTKRDPDEHFEEQLLLLQRHYMEACMEMEYERWASDRGKVADGAAKGGT